MANINLVTNPSFETNLTGWTFTNASGAQDTTNIIPGAGATTCKVTATSAAAASANYTISGLSVGKTYTVSFYVKISAVSTDFSVIPTLTGVRNSLRTLRTGDKFVRRYAGFTATGTTAALSIVSETANAVGDIFWIENVQVNEGTLLPYFDGSYPYCTWSGTAHASTSTGVPFAASIAGTVTTDEVVVVNGLCLNNLAWNITNKNGRSTLPSTRGDDYTIPSVNGKVFAPNKPLDSGLFTLSMFILGAYPDGTVPPSPAQRAFLRNNLEQLLKACYSISATVPVYTWGPDGSVRTAPATLAGSSAVDPSFNMGGRRAELSLAFSILSGVWSDYLSTTVTGTAGSGWSNQTLTLTGLSDGTAAIDDSVITVTGPITNPTVSNAETGTSVTFTGTVPTGQTWVIDNGAWTSKVNGTSVLSTTTHAGHPRFVLIGPGAYGTAPTLTLVGSSTAAGTNLSVTAKRKHLVS